MAGFSRMLKCIDVQRRLSPTCDQSKEMACHEQLSLNTSVSVYYDQLDESAVAV